MPKPYKPILCLDFDGVLHSYTSGWKGARNIPDGPMPGALEFLVEATNYFAVSVLSSRSHQFGGRRAMKRWLRRQFIALGMSKDIPAWWEKRIDQSAFADPWDYEVEYATSLVMKEIRWPIFKPPALMTIDDRAVQFKGEWPTVEAMKGFKPYKLPKP